MNKKTILGILILILVSLLVFVVVKFGFQQEPGEDNKIINSIEEYGYILEDNESTLHKELFNELVNILEKEEIDEEEYAKTVVKLFISDFYNFKNKVTKNDVGGLQFIHSSIVENVEYNAKNTIYKYIENNIDGKRTQSLPEVIGVDIIDTKQVEFEYNDTEDKEAYEIKVNIKYSEELGYQNDATLILVHEGKKLSIAELN